MRPRATCLSLTVAVVFLTAPWLGAPGAAAVPRKVPPELAPVATDALSRALAAGRISPATYALERVRSLFDLQGVRARLGDVARPDPRTATILMRDLVLRLADLSAAQRSAARRILARPTDDGGPSGERKYQTNDVRRLCDPHVCVHYVVTTADAPPLSDEGGAVGIPDHVETVSDVLADVWAAEIDEMGYRPPKSDRTSEDNGGDARLDVYLANIGVRQLFGYCTTDDPNQMPGSGYRFWDASAYCVLDDDFSTRQFGYPNPIDPLSITAAHEFFHAVQFAYDFAEDVWLHESTATWIEDEIYDNVNDNRGFLDASPLTEPGIPLDKSVFPRWYGTWIFWRFLSEFLGPGAASDQTIVRAVWRRVDGSGPTRPDMFSTRGLAASLKVREVGGAPWTLRRAFRDFASWNARPRAFYEEGSRYPAAKVANVLRLSGADSSKRVSMRLDHLASRYVVVRRGAGLPTRARLRVRVDGPALRTGPEAAVVTITRAGPITVRRPRLDASGDAGFSVDFGRSVARVVVIMVNGSSRYRACFAGLTPFACFGGTPVDQDRPYAFRVRVV